jgi:hypothetical protein
MSARIVAKVSQFTGASHGKVVALLSTQRLLLLCVAMTQLPCACTTLHLTRALHAVVPRCDHGSAAGGISLPWQATRNGAGVPELAER